MIDTSRNMLYHLGNLSEESYRIENSMATKQKISKGSEDSLLHGDLINLEDKLRVTESLKLQIEKSKALNDTADTNIGDVKKTLDKIKNELMNSLNAGMDRSDKAIIATTLKGYRQTLIDRVNTQIDGEYLFAGSVPTKQTLVKDANFDENGKIEFGGDAFLRKIAVQPGSYRERGVTAYDISHYNADSANAGDPLSFEDGDRIIDDNGNEWKLNANGNRLQKYDYNGVLIEPKEEINVSTGKAPSVKVDLGIGSNTDAKGDYIVKITDDTGLTYTYTYTASGNSTTAPAPGPYASSADEIFNAVDGLEAQIEATMSGPDQLFSVSRNGDSFTIVPNKSANISVEIYETDNKYDMTATNEIEGKSGVQSVKGTYELTVPGTPESAVFETKHNYFEDLNRAINALDGYTTKLDGTRGSSAADDLVEDILRDVLDKNKNKLMQQVLVMVNLVVEMLFLI